MEDLKALQARQHVACGLLVAVEQWDLVSARIHRSDDEPEAYEQLMQPPLSLSPEEPRAPSDQAEILDRRPSPTT